MQLQALQLDDLPEAQWPYLYVRILLGQPEPDLRTQVQAALLGKPVRLVRIEIARPLSGELPAPPLSIDEFTGLNPAVYFARLYNHRYVKDPPAAIMAAFIEWVNSAVNSDAHT